MSVMELIYKESFKFPEDSRNFMHFQIFYERDGLGVMCQVFQRRRPSKRMFILLKKGEPCCNSFSNKLLDVTILLILKSSVFLLEIKVKLIKFWKRCPYKTQRSFIKNSKIISMLMRIPKTMNK